MTHGLAVRKGKVSILCNGRPAVNTKGIPTNRFTGVGSELIEAIRSTEDNKTRVLIPQNCLHDAVDCKKCRSLMDPSLRRQYMRKIYKNSWRWKARRANRKAQKQNVLQPLTHSSGNGSGEKTHQNIEISSKKTLHITISFV